MPLPFRLELICSGTKGSEVNQVAKRWSVQGNVQGLQTSLWADGRCCSNSHPVKLGSCSPAGLSGLKWFREAGTESAASQIDTHTHSSATRMPVGVAASAEFLVMPGDS